MYHLSPLHQYIQIAIIRTTGLDENKCNVLRQNSKISMIIYHVMFLKPYEVTMIRYQPTRKRTGTMRLYSIM